MLGYFPKLGGLPMNSELNYFLQTISNGISLGSMYSMIAVGYSMVYSLLYQVNFAHGDLYVYVHVASAAHRNSGSWFVNSSDWYDD